MDEIIAYLQTKYDSAAILVYGSFADGTQNENSDFDAPVLSPTHREFHDTSFVGETQLDVFVYPVSLFQGEYHPETFLQVYGGILVMDTEGVGHALLQQVEAYVKALPGKTPEKQEGEIQWCKKNAAAGKAVRCRRGLPMALAADGEPGNFLRYCRLPLFLAQGKSALSPKTISQGFQVLHPGPDGFSLRHIESMD